MGGRGVTSFVGWARSGLSGSGRSIDVTNQYAGMTLEEAENALRGITTHEVAVIFDKDMNVIAAYSGGSGSVALPDSLKNEGGITVTHNHPPGYADYGATFSPADVSWFAGSRAAEIRAVGSGQGEYVYSLQVRDGKSQANSGQARSQLKLWAASMVRDATPRSKGGTGKLQAEYDRIYKANRKNGMSAKAAAHSAWQKATGKLERSLSDKADQLGSGAVYFSKNKKYKVNR